LTEDTRRFADIEQNLTQDDRGLILEISRIFKSRTRIFNIRRLEIKKSLEGIDIAHGLKRLQGFGIAEQVDERKGLWMIVKGATKFYHDVADEELKKRYPDLTLRRR